MSNVARVVNVTLINLDTGVETILSPKPNSRCLFMNWFTYKNYKIQLRLDNNNDPTVDPILDADIKDATTGELIKKGTWHHTEKKFDAQSNTQTYSFQFEDLPLRLKVVMSVQIQIKSTAMLTYTVETKVTHCQSEKPIGSDSASNLKT